MRDLASRSAIRHSSQDAMRTAIPRSGYVVAAALVPAVCVLGCGEDHRSTLNAGVRDASVDVEIATRESCDASEQVIFPPAPMEAGRDVSAVYDARESGGVAPTVYDGGIDSLPLSFPDCIPDAGVMEAGTSSPDGRSCDGLPQNCGPDSTESCCTSVLVPGGSFYRNYTAFTKDTSQPATMSAIRLDKYPVTIDRYRSFVTAWNQGWRPPAWSGKHVHLNGGCGLSNSAEANYEGGWHPAWDARVDTTVTNPNSGTYPAHANWYAAYAFCIWDGGFLPSDAEWNYAAAGGGEQRHYPWSVPPYSLILGIAYAYACDQNPYHSDPCRAASPLVGTRPLGNGRWGHADLIGSSVGWIGSVAEWTLDAASSRAAPGDHPDDALGRCLDCSYLPAASPFRLSRGGAVSTEDPSYTGPVGFRCARDPGDSAGAVDSAVTWPPRIGDKDIAFRNMSASAAYNCAVRADNGLVECWGIDNEYGRMSLVRTDVPFASVSMAPDHGCGVHQGDGLVECWGSDESGQISGVPPGVRFKSVSSSGIGSGFGHSCGVRLDDGLVECWGARGSGGTEVSGVPRDVAFKSVSAGYGFSCGVRADNGFVMCWGGDYYGEVSGVPAGVAFDLVSAGGYNPSGPFACAVRSDNHFVECWGLNDHRQVCGAPRGVPFASVSAGGRHACGVVSGSGLVVCWGDNSSGQVTDVPQGVAFASVSAGSEHTCAIRADNGFVECWGSDAWGTVSDVPRD